MIREQKMEIGECRRAASLREQADLGIFVSLADSAQISIFFTRAPFRRLPLSARVSENGNITGEEHLPIHLGMIGPDPLRS